MTDISYKVYSLFAYFWGKNLILVQDNVAMITAVYNTSNIVLSNSLNLGPFPLDI